MNYLVFQMNITNPAEDLSFEEALNQLKLIVEKLESGALKLDEAIAMFENGVNLRDICQKKLDNAKLQISKIVINEGKATHIE